MVAIILVFNLLLMYFLLGNFPAEFVKFPDPSAQEENGIWKYVWGLHTYLVGKRGQWRDKQCFSNKKGFCKKFHALFHSYIEPYHYFLAVESAYCVALSVQDFQIVHNMTHCRTLNGFLVLLLVSFIGVVIWLRPFNKPIAFHLFLLTYGFQLVSAVIAFARAVHDGSIDKGKDQTSTTLENVFNVCAFLSMIALSCKTFVDLMTKVEWTRKQYEKRQQKKERKRQRQEEITMDLNEMLTRPDAGDVLSGTYREFLDYMEAGGEELQPVAIPNLPALRSAPSQEPFTINDDDL